jgi:hypothetical protein
LFQTLKGEYAFRKATSRSLVNLLWDFVNRAFGEKIHEGQIIFLAAAPSCEPLACELRPSAGNWRP